MTMSNGGYGSVLDSLADKELLLPYFRNSIISQNWPDSYTITVDSGPYYGTGDGMFHPSSHALMGARELYYRFHPDHRDRLMFEPKTPGKEMIFAMGSALHAIVQTHLEMAGLLTGPEDCEVEYVIEEHRVRGRADFVINHPDGNTYVGEIKTMNSRSYGLLENIKPEWDAQISMALHGLGYPTAILMVLEAGLPYRMREFRVDRNDQLLSEIFEKFSYVRECIANDTPPEHCCSLNSVAMKSCPARFECWLADKNPEDVQ